MNGRSAHVTIGPHRISVTVSGAGGPAVVIEPAFGGSAQSWEAVARTLSEETTVVTYDRAAYGTSSRAMDGRTPREIARDLHGRRWHGLHEDLARLSANSRHVVAGQPGHYIHKSEPGLVTDAILEVVRSVRARSPLADPAA
jgi:pimeloyl-ACP methyl ester carboxylesterase